MKIIFGPAKGWNKIEPSTDGDKPLFAEDADTYAKLISEMNKDSLGDHLKIQGKLLDNVYEWYQNFGDKFVIAIKAITGTSYKELELDKWTDDMFAWAHQNVYIIDALYGVIRPCDLIGMYRLDFTKNVKDNRKVYKEKINKLLKDEDVIINLASKEFSSLVDHPNMITLDTSELNSVEAKRARGRKLNELVMNMKGEM